jgi:hypothetical protein
MRHEGELSKSPKVTARALSIIDPTLPTQLVKHWRLDVDGFWYDPYLNEDGTSPTATDHADEVDL